MLKGKKFDAFTLKSEEAKTVSHLSHFLSVVTPTKIIQNYTT